MAGMCDGDLEEDMEDWTDTSWAAPSPLTTQTLYNPRPKTARDSQQGAHGVLSEAADQSTSMPSQDSSLGTALPQGSKDSQIVSRMQINDHKAGMQGLDRERINAIILEASKGSRFYENELKREHQVNSRVEEQHKRMAALTAADIAYGEQQGDVLLSQLEETRDLSRCMVHLDMDAFYAAVEMRDNPSLRYKPMAVGCTSMLCTSNYLARKFGVRAAMPGFIGKKLCPELVIIPTNFEKYTAVSKQVRQVLADYDPNFSPMSLDEAYLDITEYIQQRATSGSPGRLYWRGYELCVCESSAGHSLEGTVSGESQRREGPAMEPGSWSAAVVSSVQAPHCVACQACGKMARKEQDDVKSFGCTDEEIVQEIRYRIEMATQLTASAGIAPNTLIAKVCSDKNKPNGQCKIDASRQAVLDFMHHLPIRKVSGIGKVSEKMLSALDVKLCCDLYHKRGLLYHLYSAVSFQHFMRITAGIGATRIDSDSDRKSISVERTFSELHKPSDLYARCQELSESLSEDLKDEALLGKTVTLKFKTVNFQQKTRAQSLKQFTASSDVIYQAVCDLLRTEIQTCYPNPLRLRLLGVRMSNLVHASELESKQNSIKDIFQRVSSRQSPRKSPASDPESSRQVAEAPPALPSGKDPIKSVFPKVQVLAPCTNNTGQREPDAEQLPPNSIDSSSKKSPPKPFTICPVCEKEIRSRSLTMITVHIDKCLLAQGRDATDRTERDELDQMQNTIGSSAASKRQETGLVNMEKAAQNEFIVNSSHEVNARKGSGCVTDDLAAKTKAAVDSSLVPCGQPELPGRKALTSNNYLIPYNKSSAKEFNELECVSVLSAASEAVACPVAGDWTSSKPAGASAGVEDSALNTSDKHFPSTSMKSQTNISKSAQDPVASLSKVSLKPRPAEEVYSELLDTLAQEKAKLLSSQSHLVPSSPAERLLVTAPAESVSSVRPAAPVIPSMESSVPCGSAVSRVSSVCRGASPELACPVCCLPQPAGDMVAFNGHVDSCLNRRAIRDMLKEEQGQTSGKRLSVDASGPPNKKKKVTPARTIDSFFRSNRN